MSQKSYDGKPTLYLVPTPIGNLGDMTYRGVETLKNSEVIFSEDTRESKKLLDMMGGKISFESVYQKGTTFIVELEQEIVNKTKITDNNSSIFFIRTPPHQSYHFSTAQTVEFMTDFLQ